MRIKPISIMTAAVPFITCMERAAAEKFDFPEIKSRDSLVNKHLTKEIWDKLKYEKTETTGATLMQSIANAVEFHNQKIGIFAPDADAYQDFALLFDPIIKEYHDWSQYKLHNSNLNPKDLKGTISEIPIESTRIRVSRNIEGFGLSPGITRDQRIAVEQILMTALTKLDGELAGNYYPLSGMGETVRQHLVNDHFLFMSGDPFLQVAGMERDWPEARGIFVNKDKTFLVWVNEEDQLKAISMQQGGDIKKAFERLVRGLDAIEKVVKMKNNGKGFMFDKHLGFLSSNPANLGTGMRASVRIDLKGFKGFEALQQFIDENKLGLQARGTRDQSGGQTSFTYNISNKRRLGVTEVETIQGIINGVQKIYKESQRRAGCRRLL